MNIVSLENVSKSFGFKPLVVGASFGIDSADKVGLIGRNGSGKTTLLRMIAGLEQPDEGRIVVAREVDIAFLLQNHVFGDDETVLDAVFPPTSEASRLLHDYELACRELADRDGADEALLARVAELTDRIGDSGGWDLEANARIVLGKLGIVDTRERMSTLSGGQRKRVALARALVARPSLLILDEPTNHLDAVTIEWLESHLADYSGALLVVTHDRYFLDRVTRRIVEIDRGSIRSFEGNYGYFLEKKAEIEHARETADKRRETDLRRELAWLQRGARARTTKEKARVQRVAELQAVPRATVERDVEIGVAAHRLGTKIVEIDDVTKGYDGRDLFRNFTYTLKRRDRIGIVGPNGSGKTTLLDVIAGRTSPDEGTVAIGETVVLGYYDQEKRDVDPTERAIDHVSHVVGRVTLADGTEMSAGQLLERFLFPPDMQYAPIGNYSGGELRRLFLVRILMTAPNVLLLDEPTNDLDIATLARLEEYLDSFPGCVIVVSHDRYFLDRTVEHVFDVGDDAVIRMYPGNYSAFREARERERRDVAVDAAGERARAQKAAPVAVASADVGPRKLTFKERRELDELESRIESTEARRAQLESALGAAGADYVQLQALTEELHALEAALATDVERWGELAERA